MKSHLMETPNYFDGCWEIVSIKTRNGESLPCDFETLRSYIPKDKRWLVTRTKFKKDCFNALFGMADTFWAERLSRNEWLLYSLTALRDDPTDYQFKIKIRRITRNFR